MIPDYCVPDLAKTGSSVVLLSVIAAVAVVVGLAFLVRKKRGGTAIVLGMALVVSGAALPTQTFAATAKQCPAGYHYDASKDKSAQPEAKAGIDRPASDESWMAPRTTFTMKADGSTGKTASGEELINWDVAKKTLRAYMNASKEGIADKNDSPYIRDVTSIARDAADKVAAQCEAAVAEGKKPAAVFDSDDTTLWTYDMEDHFMNFAFTSAKQQAWFDAGNYMPATPGMVDLVKKVHKAGCQIIGLTGRKTNQQAYTIANLEHAGYVDEAGKPLFVDDFFFTKFKDGPMPDYLVKQGRCNVAEKKCTTVQFKAGTRQHIQEDLGYTIIGNFGDQWSDLQGGQAQTWVKLPNATYYLPSPNLDEEWEARDKAAGMAPDEATYVVAPDGSSGSKPGVKDTDIPNMDIVKKTLREYYKATEDKNLKQYVSNKEESPYVAELTAVTGKAQQEVVAQCQAARARGEKPAITVDADDTTLWTYDMEEWMEFAFTPKKQDEYLKTNYHALPAVPGMVNLVKAAKAAGCEVIGLTGRSDDLKEVTQRNLEEVGYPAIDPSIYFTKKSSKLAELPAWVSCAKEKCTTIEFKSSVRKHIENDLGYRIVGNFGDQYSDLIGGYADAHYKLPNPTYYLP
ncbi:HAD family acid phosphatase [Arcanobacterium haemolyticum]|uniref:LPXTG-motif cell wall anchor domain protein n=1 Tax=Arcanobacterium haemolyticum (strain ATCC 9345 / DSM 20595 / CCM 5947 / CCUG 17215 / LMG 16163 / NBRC 15585 / NCTC 8452 / 11018) TaxID=644284 RepID=D7BN54_ARCHD|nr:HAD family acid phosphatase [Arcanobacterium haemolyticum]ADH92353.1 LPXTG-motif cell wall anchor domain protein [Arcanobacterium haemolyticum DSM 20595]SQH28922.1 plant acid phosphatase [Arcanobacterium haemolyticum]